MISKSIYLVGDCGEWHFNDLQRAATQRSVLLVPIRFEDLAANVSTHSTSVSSVVELSSDAIALVRAVSRGSLEQIVFRMNCLAAWERQGARLVNSSRSIESCIDKFQTLALLQQRGIPVPRTIVCQSANQAFAAWETFGGRAVLKPLFGSEGRGIGMIDSATRAIQYFQMMEDAGQVIYLQQFIEHRGFDTRILVIGNQILSMRRENSTDWRTNTSRGATAVAHDATATEQELALAVAQCLGAELCGVDIVRDAAGNPFVIEANAVPGWHSISQVVDQDIAATVLDLVLK
ncbi:MAG: RimK family alpha-L-glutamate ligase [Pirellulaceae bacterium]